MIDHITIDEKLKKDELAAKAVKGSNHYLVLAGIKIKGRRENGRKKGKGKVSKVLASKMMERKDVKEENEK